MTMPLGVPDLSKLNPVIRENKIGIKTPAGVEHLFDNERIVSLTDREFRIFVMTILCQNASDPTFDATFTPVEKPIEHES